VGRTASSRASGAWRLELKPSSESAPTAGTYGGYWDVAAALSCLGKGPGRPVSCKIFLVSFVFGRLPFFSLKRQVSLSVTGCRVSAFVTALCCCG